jgi:hypothetical protein
MLSQACGAETGYMITIICDLSWWTGILDGSGLETNIAIEE